MAMLVEVARFHSLPEAAVAQSCLEAYGHTVVAMEANHASIAWHHLFAIGGLRLATPAQEADQARFLLAALGCSGDDLLAKPDQSEQPSPGLLKRCLSIVLLFTLSVIVPPQVMKRRPAL